MVGHSRSSVTARVIGTALGTWGINTPSPGLFTKTGIVIGSRCRGMKIGWVDSLMMGGRVMFGKIISLVGDTGVPKM